MKPLPLFSPEGPDPAERGCARPPPRLARISLTDRCDLACVYCRPHRQETSLPRQHRLAADDWVALVEILVECGVERVRLTGGEPLLHPDILEVVARVGKIPGVKDVALTTNGTRLSALAGPLRRAGLTRLNVSLDSLQPDRFWQITRGGRLSDVLEGIEHARAAGFSEIKTNTVVLAPATTNPCAVGNQDELLEITRWAWDRDITPRFLERMPVGEGARMAGPSVLFDDFRGMFDALLEPGWTEPRRDRGPARYARARDGSGHLAGFILGTSAQFCDGCDRIRVTSDGQIRPCLALVDGSNVRAALALRDREAVRSAVEEAWGRKPRTADWRGCAEPSAELVSMRETGG